MRVELFPSEVEALRQLDRVVREYYAKKDQPEKMSIADQMLAVKAAHEERNAAAKIRNQR